MEIHAPHQPVHGWKDFATHIAIVTIGILIALGLDGLREYFHNRHLVRDTRENVRTEMEANYRQSLRECGQVHQILDFVTPLSADLSASALHPEQIAVQTNRVGNPSYFFSAASWQAALSTGALAHMRTDEVTAYASAASAVGIYTSMQKDALSQEMRTKAFFAANPHPNQTALALGLEQFANYAHAEQILSHVCPQMQEAIRGAIVASGGEVPR